MFFVFWGREATFEVILKDKFLESRLVRNSCLFTGDVGLPWHLPPWGVQLYAFLQENIVIVCNLWILNSNQVALGLFEHVAASKLLFCEQCKWFCGENHEITKVQAISSNDAGGPC